MVGFDIEYVKLKVVCDVKDVNVGVDMLLMLCCFAICRDWTIL
jgi:hypothetical protein